MPTKEPLSQLFPDLNLIGKLVFYSGGFIFVDQRLNCFVLSYEDIAQLNFHVGEGYWLEVKTKQQHTMPANMICGDTFFIKITKAIFDEKYKAMQQMQETRYPDSLKVDKKYGLPEQVVNSLAYKNHEINKKYSKFLSSNYLNFSFREGDYRELLEFQSMLEFNLVRAKEFVAFQSFHKVYQDAQKKIPYGNYAQLLVDKLKQ